MTHVFASLSNPLFILLTICTVIIATLTSGVLGWLVKFNFVEASITPGLVMADTGGSGDVQSSAQRTECTSCRSQPSRTASAERSSCS